MTTTTVTETTESKLTAEDIKDSLRTGTYNLGKSVLVTSGSYPRSHVTVADNPLTSSFGDGKVRLDKYDLKELLNIVEMLEAEDKLEKAGWVISRTLHKLNNKEAQGDRYGI